MYSPAWSDSVHPAILGVAGEGPPTALSSSQHLSCLVLSTLHSLLPASSGNRPDSGQCAHPLSSCRPEPSTHSCLPQIQETPFHELLISNSVRGKVSQGLQRLRPSSLPGSIIASAGRRVCHSPPLLRSLSHSLTLSLSLFFLSLTLSHSLSPSSRPSLPLSLPLPPSPSLSLDSLDPTLSAQGGDPPHATRRNTTSVRLSERTSSTL